jgi:hypothetical protein
MKINTISNLLALVIIFALLNLYAVYASEPSEPHDANALWVEPSTIDLTTYSIGSKFNVTLWANMSTVISPAVGIDTWQVKLYFNKTYLQALRAGYTAGSTSELFQGLATVPVTPVIDNTLGYVLHSETCAPSWKEVPCTGSLFWIEFNVTALTPTPISFLLNITNTDTALVDNEGNIYPPNSITRYNGTIIPEFSQLLLIATLMVLTLFAISFKKYVWKSKVSNTNLR